MLCLADSTSPSFSPSSISNRELSDLIERLQKNADQVERNVVDTDSKLQKDMEKVRCSQPVTYKESTAHTISESDRMIVVLETDAVMARQMNHPQGEMISEDIRQLKERLKNQRSRHAQIYNQTVPVGEAPRVNWSKVIDDKTDVLNSRGFATDLPNLEGDIEEHNIFHNEVKAIGDHVNKDSDKDYISGLQVKYQKLMSASQKRHRDLNTLQDYMQRCTNELYWLDQQEKERMEYDWSDRNTDYISRRKQYENFIQRSLEAKEDEVSKLQEEGEKLIAAGHPAKIPIEAHMEAVHADWKEYLNLLICEESHLKYMEDYHQQPEVEVRQESVQMSQSEKPTEETWKIKNMLDDEVQRRQQLESEIKSTQNEIIFFQNQKPQETIVKKEVLKKVPDPQLEEDYHKVLEKVSEEQRKNKSLQDELDSLRLKVRVSEYEQKEGGQQYIVKEVLRIEKDKEQQEEFLRLKEELEELKRQKGAKQSEIASLQERMSILAKEKNKQQEKITEKEVIKLQNDPQLAMDYRLLQENKQRESTQRQKEEEELLLLQEKMKRLEKERAMAEGKITVKEVLKVEKDLESEREVADLRRHYEEETTKIRTTLREKNELIRKITILEDENAKVVVQEKVREIVRPDPKAESELANLRQEVIEQERKYRTSEEQVKSLQNEMVSLKKRGPQVEVKEITKEVIKHKTDPEILAELEKLRGEILEKTRVVERSELEITQLKQEIQSWIDTKPQVQIKEVVQEVLQYREDPKTKNELETLRSRLAEEQKKRLDLERERMSQEDKIRQKERELSQVKEKVVQQEVVKFEEDPVLKSEVNSFSKSIDNELKQKDSLQEELRKLQYRKSELERQLEELERERQARREAELEIQKLKIRLNELEQREIATKEKVTLKQKVVLQQDPQQEKEHNLLKLQVEEEKHRRQMLETELEALHKKFILLEKMEVKEKVVFTEKIEVEKDAETEKEIQRLKVSLDEESRRKRELDAESDHLKSQLAELEFSNSKANKELEYLREDTHKMQMDKQSLQLETRHMQSEIQITIKEAQDLRSMTQVDSSVNLDSRFKSLEEELNELKKISRDKDIEIEQLQKRLETMAVKREQRENHLRRSIVVIDPDTGREMSPEEARNLGLIDWRMFVNLQSQECDWEETTIKGPNGDSSVILDRKSGRKFDIEHALRCGMISKRQYDSYLNKEMSIQEFAALVSGKK
ncbi:hypothetical protein FKM82_002791 [Ascaphus truei]